MAANNSNLISVFLDGTKVAVATSHDLDLSQETIEVTSKDDGGVAQYIPGKQDGTVSIEGHVDPSAGNYSRIFGLLKASSTVSFKVEDTTSPGNTYTGTGILTNVNRSGENDSVESFSAELQKTGSITES